MIVLDSEASGLVKPEGVPLKEQPFLMEFAAIKVDFKTLKEQELLTFLVKPPVPISAEVTKITGITAEMVAGAKSFAAHYRELVEFFLGERIMIAHNCAYDRAVLSFELRRLDRLLLFPWPPEHMCTVELTQDKTGKYQKQSALYQHYFGVDPAQTHRALDDALQLLDIIRAMRKEDLV